MTKSRFLYSVDLQGYERYGRKISLNVVGLFNTHDVSWNYYVVSTFNRSGLFIDNFSINFGNRMFITDDVVADYKNISSSGVSLIDVTKISRFGIDFDDDLELAKKYVDDFKLKWETGSNNISQEIRDKKLKDIINES